MERTADVVVVGSGIIGLTTALRLQDKGLRVVVVTADGLLSTTSAVAAAVWYPVGVDVSSRVAEWGAATLAEFARQAEAGIPGVSMRNTRMAMHRQQPPGTPWWGAAVPELRRLTPAERGPAYADGWSFTAPAVEMPLYLPWLLGRVLDNGGDIVHRRLDVLAQARAWAPVVVNATGLGARQLCGDHAVHPIRGQLVLVRNPGLHTSTRIQDDPAGYTYVHPRSTDVVLGGTFDEDDWNTTPDPATAAAILTRCTAHVPDLRGARVLGHAVGLRPARRGGIRLEATAPDRSGTRYVHNYGHGGAGVTLSWGCADAAAELAAAAVGGPSGE
ncbi:MULTISPECIES: FAD-dependent oxidoreductase [Streptomyces]|uniref:FAD-dependent oxidoreductase n=1 Tax=Streptomyces TaxID=1883 RepID=UPI0004A9DDF2|nr:MULTISPECIES: FAD-dependent oxidoreductase [Streptomyces]